VRFRCRAAQWLMATEKPVLDMLGDVVGATGRRYDAKDSAGHGLDTLKIIGNPAGGYLGVYHTGDIVRLATSSDLLTWTVSGVLDPQATQPTIVGLPTGGFLTAVEYNDQAGSGGLVRLRHYPDLDALLAGRHDRRRTVPRTLSRCNEGALLPIRTHGGSAAFANPSITAVTSPSGRPAVVLTMFVPGEGAAPGEAGELIYYREIPTQADDPAGREFS